MHIYIYIFGFGDGGLVTKLSNSCDPMDSSLPGSSVLGCNFLLQRICLTQESNLGLLHCRQILY